MPKDDLSYQSLIETVPTMTEALERCYLLGGMRPKEAAFKLDIDYSAFTRMLSPNDPRHFPPDLIERMMRISGNLFPLDWLERRMGRAAHPMEVMQILEDIRQAMIAEGKDVHFALKAMMEKRGI